MANRTARMIVCVAAVSVAALGAASIAAAQNNPPPAPPAVTDSQAPGRVEAPVGHRQPRPADLPKGSQGDQVQVAPAELDLNKKLEICRGC